MLEIKILWIQFYEEVIKYCDDLYALNKEIKIDAMNALREFNTTNKRKFWILDGKAFINRTQLTKILGLYAFEGDHIKYQKDMAILIRGITKSNFPGVLQSIADLENFLKQIVDTKFIPIRPSTVSVVLQYFEKEKLRQIKFV